MNIVLALEPLGYWLIKFGFCKACFDLHTSWASPGGKGVTRSRVGVNEG